MFCPRCGRPVNAEANFCGGCGLSKVEIEKYLNKTAPQQETTKVDTVFNAPVQNEPVQPKAEETPEADVVCEAPKAEPVFVEPETVKAETPVQTEAIPETQHTTFADNNCTYAYSYKNADNSAAQPQAENTAGTAADASFQPAKTEPKTEAPLSTVDFIWMFVISAIPVIGFIYIIYLAVQNNNTNKRSFARATLIVGVFSIIISLVFAVGVVAAGLIG